MVKFTEDPGESGVCLCVCVWGGGGGGGVGGAGGVAGEYYLIWPQQVCAAEQGVDTPCVQDGRTHNAIRSIPKILPSKNKGLWTVYFSVQQCLLLDQKPFYYESEGWRKAFSF